MTLNFGAQYASGYDALYRERNYAAETLFVLDQIQNCVPHKPRQILDLGCGTGLHDVQLAEKMIWVTGIDRSAHMVRIAEKRRELLSDKLRNILQFKVGDVCT